MPFCYGEPVDRIAANSVLLTEGERAGCWYWLGSRNNVGRPRITVRINGRVKRLTVARYIVQFVHGKTWGRNLARRKVGAHSCDWPDCVNPDHVRGATQKQNVRECVARGRHDAMSGVRARLESRP